LLTLAWPEAWAHGDKPHSESTPDTATSVLVTAQVRAFTEALDSVYTSISGTFLGIEPILKRSCYDCHSDATRYPWYHKIPGIRGMIDNDIREARKHLDLSAGFPLRGHASQEEQLNAMRDEIESGGMPILSYRIMHWNSRIDGTAKDSVFQWIDSSLSAIRQVMSAHGVVAPDSDAATVYICPMDPEVVSARPGRCPKCGMDLEERDREARQHDGD
jgi:hypothetical protein